MVSYYQQQQQGGFRMNEWANDSMINEDAIDKLTEEQVAELLDILRDF